MVAIIFRECPDVLNWYFLPGTECILTAKAVIPQFPPICEPPNVQTSSRVAFRKRVTSAPDNREVELWLWRNWRIGLGSRLPCKVWKVQQILPLLSFERFVFLCLTVWSWKFDTAHCAHQIIMGWSRCTLTRLMEIEVDCSCAPLCAFSITRRRRRERERGTNNDNSSSLMSVQCKSCGYPWISPHIWQLTTWLLK